jgi:hypothetical protein
LPFLPNHDYIHQTLEVNGTPEGTKLTIVPIRQSDEVEPLGDDEAGGSSPLRCGSFLTFTHREDNSVLVFDKSLDRGSPVFVAAAAKDGFNTPASDSSHAVWKIESVDVEWSGDRAQWSGQSQGGGGMSYRIKHMATNQYLAVDSRGSAADSGAPSSFTMCMSSHYLNAECLWQISPFLESDLDSPITPTSLLFLQNKYVLEMESTENPGLTSWLGTPDPDEDSLLSPSASSAAKGFNKAVLFSKRTPRNALDPDEVSSEFLGLLVATRNNLKILQDYSAFTVLALLLLRAAAASVAAPAVRRARLLRRKLTVLENSDFSVSPSLCCSRQSGRQ